MKTWWSRFWNLSWWVKAPVLVVVAMLVVGGISSAFDAGGDDAASGEPGAAAVESVPVETVAAVLPSPSPAPTPDAGLEYLAQAVILLDEARAIIDDAMTFVDESLEAYEAGILFPDSSGAVAARTRWQGYSDRVSALEPPGDYVESHALWVAGNQKILQSLDQLVLGVETADVSAIEEGTTLMGEGSDLIGRAADAIE